MCISKKVPPAKQEHLIAVTNRHLFDEAGGQSAFLARLEQVAAAHPAAVILREKDMEEGTMRYWRGRYRSSAAAIR